MIKRPVVTEVALIIILIENDHVALSMAYISMLVTANHPFKTYIFPMPRIEPSNSL